MAKQRKPAVDYAVYLIVRCLICLIQALPIGVALMIADGLAWLAYRIDRRHREVAADNLRHAFPEVTDPAAIDRQVRAVFRHFIRLVVEIALLPRKLHAGNWRRHVQFAQLDVVIDRLLSRRPLFFLTGHFGNWEAGGYVLGLLGFRTYAVARVLDNPYLDDFLRSFREKTGQKLLAKKGDFDQMEAILRTGGVIATLADQDAGQRGLFVDFFHRPASTHKAVALLAIEHNVPMLVTGVRHLGRPLCYEVAVTDVIDPADYAGKPDAVRLMTQRFSTALEQIIRQAPEQYFWLHRRWKHQPAKRKSKQAA